MTRKKKRIIICIAGAVLLVVALTVALLMMPKDRKLPVWEDAPEEDFRGLAWGQAFEQLNRTLSHRYVFTEWKGIRWQELYHKYLPQIEKAQADNSFEDYYLTLRAYINEIPDGHVRMSHHAEIDYQYTGGAFGFTATQLDDGSIIVTWVDPDGPARSAGLKKGDKITEWNGSPIGSAIEAVSVIFSDPSATSELRMQKQLAYLVRAPIGTQAKLTLSNARSVGLTAYDDGYLSIQKSYPYTVVPIEKLKSISAMIAGEKTPASGPVSVVDTQMPEDNILYVKLWGLLNLDTGNTGTPVSTPELMRKAVAYANDNQCTGMILDLRNNVGGEDGMVAEILGLFYSEKTLYEYQRYTVTDEMPVLYIEPAPLRYDGRIIAIINSQCASSGEGLALGISNLPNGETLGFYGTNGSFGMAGATVEMPDGLSISYPFGQSLNKDLIVQLDSRNGVGGVSPSIRIPMNEVNALRIANGEDVELEEALKALKTLKTLREH